MLIIQASYSEITQASSYYCGWSSQAVSVNGSLIQVCSNICFLSQIQSPSKANLSSHSSMVGSPIWSLRAKITVSGWLFSYLEVSFWGKSIPWLIQAVVKCQFPMVMRQGPLLPYWLSAEDCSQLLKVSLMSLPPLSKTAGPVESTSHVSNLPASSCVISSLWLIFNLTPLLEKTLVIILGLFVSSRIISFFKISWLEILILLQI